MKFLLWFSFLVVSSLAYAECRTAPAVPAKLVYQITEKLDGHSKKTETLELTRQGNRVALTYPEKGLVEYWEKSVNDQVRMTQIFTEYDRGIEYEPVELKLHRHGDDWSIKTQLVSAHLLARLLEENQVEDGKQCDTKLRLKLKDDHQNVFLNWDAKRKIVNKMKVKTDHKWTQWKLLDKQFDEKAILTFLDKQFNYPTVDYADIGDREEDPFLVKMINLGFVAHGNSGFYDSQGHDIGAHSGHAH